MPTSLITENTLLVLVGLIVLAIIVVTAVVLYRRGHWRFSALTVMLALAAALVVPLVASQRSAGYASAVVQSAKPVSMAVAQAVTPSVTVNPTNTATPFNTPTALPSLTPTVSETPIVLYTPIVYVSTYAMTTPTSCSVIAKTQTYLRGDASENMASIGTIFAGSLLNVTGRIANNQWWQVISTQIVSTQTSGTQVTGTPIGDISIEGWVRADAVTADSACTDASVPVIGPTATPTRVRVSANSTSAVTPGPCVLLTTIAASLRPDPSRQGVPLLQIPQGIALAAISKSADSQWWNVSYGDQNGWIGGGAVAASVSCAAVPTITPAAH